MFRSAGVYKSYVYTTLYSIKYATALCLEKVHTKNTLLLKMLTLI